MSVLPRVSVRDRELVAEEFDNRGPAACLAEIVEQLKRENPEVLDMAERCAADWSSPEKLMVGFGMFYRLLVLNQPSASSGTLLLVPRLSPEARERVVAEIDEEGSEAFSRAALADLETGNPELFQMAHHFASGIADYLHAMQGFALLYRSLVVQSTMERARPH
jgi:hypothetical protein